MESPYNPRQNILISFLLGVYATTGSASVGVLAMAAIESLRAYWINLTLVTVAIGGLVASGYGIVHLLRPAWPVNPIDLLPEADQPDRSLTTVERIRSDAYEVINLHFLDGLAATREECEARGVSQTNWNLINRCLKATGLKSDRAWQVATLQEAADRWRRQVTIGDDMRIWVKPTPESNITQRID